MKIVYDDAIPFGAEAFGTLGDAYGVCGRDITRAVLHDANVLCVRSVTSVDAALLEGTSVRVVATATSGTDHIDQEYLRTAGIFFVDAHGSNADAVTEYVIAALCDDALRTGNSLAGKSLGVIGVGAVGSRVACAGAALGMRVIVHDPPRAQREPTFISAPKEETLCCDVVSLHTSLTHSGAYATYHCIDETALGMLPCGALLINTARGAVVDSAALYARLRRDRTFRAVLDVWENEPTPLPDLVAASTRATAHIAGHSWHAKVAATVQIYRALCQHFSVSPTWTPPTLAADVPAVQVHLSPHADAFQRVCTAVHSAYDISADDARMRGILREPPEKHAQYFDALRKNYPVRYAFSSARVEGKTDDIASVLRGCGFVL